MVLLENPRLQDAEQVITESIQAGRMTIIVGKCVVNYYGRAGSVLPEGERLIIIKEDGSVLVHQKDKYTPVNYQPTGCNVQCIIKGDSLAIMSQRKRPKEVLHAFFSSIQCIASFELLDDENITLVGSERDLALQIFQQPDMIEKGLKITEIEKAVSSGEIDLFGEDCEGKLVIIELKRKKVGLESVSQLKRYTDEIRGAYGNRAVRGMLCAPALTKNAMRLLQADGLEFIEIKPSIMTFKNGTMGAGKQ
ncbi:MAG: endonuclease NucS [Candidatus Aenigmarchaeota archaeon]|nr:endonuclease NucS [Candidatus Aenigmarchaeota archaeon]